MITFLVAWATREKGVDSNVYWGTTAIDCTWIICTFLIAIKYLEAV